LVKCLRPYGKGWPDKVKEDFCIEYATLVEECSNEKLDYTWPGQEELSDNDDRSAIDPEEVAQNFFDVDKVMGEDELEQAAEVLQETFNLKEAPSIDLLQSIREWQSQTGPPVHNSTRRSSIVDADSRPPTLEPEPVQSGADVDVDELVNAAWDEIMTPNMTRDAEETLRLFRR
jgi:hypothetical protein